MKNSYKFFENKDCEFFPCHKGLENLNCLFCYCPMYKMENCPGTPIYIDNGIKKIKSCENCTFPHNPKNYEKVISILNKYYFE